jgi:glycosyltransferase involved in cell wall biosynthesis
MTLITPRFPNATFAIVGRQPAAAVTALAQSPSIIVTGAVADVRGWLAAADVIVAPLRTARGVQNKVLEAMAMARPVVASRAAAEGIDARDGEHFLIAASPDEEAAFIIRLLADTALAQNIGAAARQHMLARYGWAAQLRALPELLGLAASAPAVRAMTACA